MRTGKKVEFWWPAWAAQCPAAHRGQQHVHHPSAIHLGSLRQVHLSNRRSHMLSRLVGESVVETQSFEWISFIFLPPTHFEMTTTLSVLIL